MAPYEQQLQQILTPEQIKYVTETVIEPIRAYLKKWDATLIECLAGEHEDENGDKHKFCLPPAIMARLAAFVHNLGYILDKLEEHHCENDQFDGATVYSSGMYRDSKDFQFIRECKQLVKRTPLGFKNSAFDGALMNLFQKLHQLWYQTDLDFQSGFLKHLTELDRGIKTNERSMVYNQTHSQALRNKIHGHMQMMYLIADEFESMVKYVARALAEMEHFMEVPYVHPSCFKANFRTSSGALEEQEFPGGMGPVRDMFRELTAADYLCKFLVGEATFESRK